VSECVRVCAAGLEKKVRELYDAVCRLEEEKYDWEGKLGRQTEEVGRLIILLIDHSQQWPQ